MCLTKATTTEVSETTEVTTCPICFETFDNAKSLPCLHNFCLKCLQSYCKDACSGNKVPCPICRKEFEIPSNGLEGLQRSFFIQQLADARKASSEEFREVPCEVCSEESGECSDKIPTATTYCVDCNQKLCDHCSRPHRRMRGGAHQMRSLGVEVEQERIQLRGSSCDKHSDKQVELYCYDCMENICLKCSAVNHRNHNSAEIPDAADKFTRVIDDDNKRILSVINFVREQSMETEQDKTELLNRAEDAKYIVVTGGDEVKRSVDIEINDVLKKLQSVVSDSAKQAESVQEAYQLALVSMESFYTYSRELLDKGRPSDITRAAYELHDRATELLDNDITALKYHPPHVTFIPPDVTRVKRLNVIGKLTVTTHEQPGMSYTV